jgi:hypothetical protein
MKRYIYISLVAGVLTPLLIPMFLVRNPNVEILRIDLGSFILMLLALIPFVVLLMVVNVISVNISAIRLDCIFWGGFIGAWGFTVWAHWTMSYPFYAGQRVRSTHALGFLIIPFYALVPLAIGLLSGWGVSFLPAFQEGKKNKPAREEGEDDKFSL